MKTNPEIIDAVKLVFGFDMDDFRPWNPEEIEEMNASHPDDPSLVLGISDRTFSTYDPAQRCVVIAGEMFGCGQNTPQGEIQDGHVVALAWEDEQETTCFVDMNTGEVTQLKGGDEFVDLDLDESPEWRGRIISALSELAKDRLGL